MAQSPEPPTSEGPPEAPPERLTRDAAGEGEAARRSRGPALGPWLALGVILLTGVFVYVLSALFSR